MFKGLIDTIIGNLQLSISNIHVRYEVRQGPYHAHPAVSTAGHCTCMHLTWMHACIQLRRYASWNEGLVCFVG